MGSKAVKLVYFGHGIRGIRCLEIVMQSPHKVLCVVATDMESDFGRRALELGLHVIAPAKVNSDETAAELSQFGADVFVLVGYNKILRANIFSIPPKGTINLHGGKLPEYRGAAPINWQIINGEKCGACSILYVDEGIDTAPILAQEEYPIGPEDDATTIVDKTLEIFPRLLLETLQNLTKRKISTTPQDPTAGCYYTRRYPEDGLIRWKEMLAVEVHNLIRALVPPYYPGAFFELKDKRYVVLKSRLLTEKICGVPGKVAFLKDDGVVVLAKDRAILIRSIKDATSQELCKPSDILRRGMQLVI